MSLVNYALTIIQVCKFMTKFFLFRAKNKKPHEELELHAVFKSFEKVIRITLKFTQ